MERINRGHPTRFSHLLNDDNPSSSGILSGESKGDIWINDEENPSLAMVFSYPVGGFNIMGNPKNIYLYERLGDYLRNSLFEDLRSKGVSDFEFSADYSDAERYMLELFADKDIMQEEEYHFRKSDKVDVDVSLGGEYEICKVTPDFLKEINSGKFRNPSFLTNRLLDSWASYEVFHERSIAFVAVSGNEIASVMVGTSRHNDILPIDIETEENHRRKGLALCLTENFVNECVERGLTAQWNCVESNGPSIGTAKKAGFELIRKKPFYWFDLV